SSRTSRQQIVQSDEDIAGIENVKIFSYKELNSATENFSPGNKIGQGGFGSVYKGKLKNGSVVAIKVLSSESKQGTREFLNELSTIANIVHENLVTLYGCCVEGNRRILVYNYLENNSLAETLLGGNRSNIQFSWRTRTNICIGVARGLAFLHEEVKPHIVHRDIKASYLAPEYAIHGKLTKKADIYSFGVLLLEIVSGRCNTNTRLPYEDQFLLERIWALYEHGELVNIVDTSLNGDFNPEEACRFLKVGLICTQDAPKVRPTMSTVIKMLTGETDTDMEIMKPGLISDFMDLKVRTHKPIGL
ncbi:putative leucine-rich repeat receptor-like serine/threonine-protein kinase, partial [Ananas comosus]